MIALILIFGVIGAYLLGSISSAIVVCRLLRLPDPRSQGSGNPGTTNVLRVGGKFAAALTLLGDAAKGWLPVFLVQFATSNPWVISCVFLAAVVGHWYPIFFQYKGGKGIATTLGALLGLSLSLGGIFIFTWIGVFAIFRYSSLSGLVSIISMPLFAYSVLDHRYCVVLTIVAAVIVWRHRDNIHRLWTGTESKFSTKKQNNA